MTVLAAYKPSDEGNVVLSAAMQEARRRQEKLLIVRHVEREQGATGGGTSTVPVGHSAVRSKAGQDITKLREELEAMARDIESEGIQCEVVLLDRGDDAANQLLELASSGDVDLIVVGVRRRSRVGKAVLGSDAQQIILNAGCAVLAVKAE